MREYALYKGDELLGIGTAQELADARGVKKDTIIYYSSPAYKRKAEKWKKPRTRLYAMPLTDEADDDNDDDDADNDDV